MDGVEVAAGGREGVENGLVGGGGVGERRLLGGPVEETEGERVVVEEERVDDSGHECGC